MAELTDSQTYFDDESESLRKTLEQMRKDAEEEVLRLNRRLAEREYEVDSSVATATERLALQQEMTVLQQTLEAKEQALDHITEECRRLEDQLEDQNSAYDSLKQEVERQEESLEKAQAEVERLTREVARLQAQADVAPQVQTLPVQVREPEKTSRLWLLSGSLAFFVVLSLVLFLLLLFGWGRLEVRFPGLESKASPAPALPVAPAAPSPRPSPPDTASRTAAGSQGEVAETPQKSPPIHRDRLPGGAFAPAMAMLEGGAFEMGSNSLSGEDFSPAHEVRLRPFLMGVYEVTFQDYDRFARATGRPLPQDFGWGRGKRPVVGISWVDALAYADWLSRQTGRRYRLPTEAEWEYAARAGTESSYWWGFGMQAGRAVCFDCGTQWDNRSTAPVGSLPPNPFGLYDTAGNAMEWVADCYRPGYEGAPTDGLARLDGGCHARVARGGAFNKPGSSMRNYVRARFLPETQLNMLGFRIARDA